MPSIAINLPPDPNGNSTGTTYDNGAMAFFLLSQIQAIKTWTDQLGIPHKFVIVGPQRVLGGSNDCSSLAELCESAGRSLRGGVSPDHDLRRDLGKHGGGPDHLYRRHQPHRGSGRGRLCHNFR